MQSFNEVVEVEFTNYELNYEKYKIILNDIIYFIKNNIDEIKKSNQFDLKFSSFKISLNKVTQIINKYKEKTPIEAFYKRIIAITYYGDFYITLNLCLEAIRTNTRIILLIENKSITLNKFFVNLINEVLKEHKIFNLISIYNAVNRKEIAINSSKFDKLICIGNKLEFHHHYKELQNSFYYDYGTLYIYCDSNKMYNLLNLIYEYAENNEIDIINIEEDNIDSAIMYLKNNLSNYKVLFLTDSKQKVEKLRKDINCEKIYINENPFFDNDFVVPQKFFEI